MLKHVDDLFAPSSVSPAFLPQKATRDGTTASQGRKCPPAGGSFLRTIAPERFAEFVRRHGDLLDQAVDQRVHRDGMSLSAELCDLSAQLGQLSAGARDVIELHARALDGKLASVPPRLTVAYREEGRFLVLELMGRLLSYYRTAFHQAAQSAGQGGPSVASSGENRRNDE
jgi:hypothetical protein